MTPAARAAAAIEVLDLWLDGDERLDRILQRWGRANRYAGSGDRRAIGDLCYGALRRRRSAAWIAGADETARARDLIRGALLLDGVDLQTIFTGVRHAPSPLLATEAESRELADAPWPVRLDVPDWLVPELEDQPAEALEAMRERAPVDLRVNLLKADRAEARAALAGDGIAAGDLALTETALRVTEGARRVNQSRAWREGLVEVQDAASQYAAELANARPGELVLDLCAGAGGKALAMAATMDGEGRLIAHDIDPRRMADLPDRALRAGAHIETVSSEGLAALTGACNLVFIDAPCSGSGTWRRDPEAKWRLDRDELDRLHRVQGDLLRQAVEFAAPGGRIVYATCSILMSENAAQISRFCRDAPDWRLTRSEQLDPTQGCDGFFVALLARDAPINLD